MTSGLARCESCNRAVSEWDAFNISGVDGLCLDCNVEWDRLASSVARAADNDRCPSCRGSGERYTREHETGLQPCPCDGSSGY